MEVTRKNNTNRLKITELNDDHTCATVTDVTDSIGGTCTSGGGMNPNTQYHLILLGKREVGCDTGNRLDRIYGPGAYVGWYNSVYICTSNPQNTTQVGLTAGGAALLGAATSLTFGGAGVCMELAFNFGVGAYAGIIINKWQ